MKITRSWTEVGGTQCSDSDVVTVTETVKLNENQMERVINKVATGTFFISASERAAWQKLKEIGTLVKYEESAEGHTITETRQ